MRKRLNFLQLTRELQKYEFFKAIKLEFFLNYFAIFFQKSRGGEEKRRREERRRGGEEREERRRREEEEKRRRGEEGEMRKLLNFLQQTAPRVEKNEFF